MNEQKTRESDYQNGYMQENKIISMLRAKGYTVNPSSRYCFYDCKINDKYICEIKSRQCKKNTFDTTILPYSKIQEFKKVRKNFKDMVLIFKFIDGSYYTTYRDVCKNHCKIKKFTRYSRFAHNSKKHVFIPIEYVKTIR